MELRVVNERDRLQEIGVGAGVLRDRTEDKLVAILWDDPKIVVEGGSVHPQESLDLPNA